MIELAKEALNSIEDGNLEDKYRREQGYTLEAYRHQDSQEARDAFNRSVMPTLRVISAYLNSMRITMIDYASAKAACETYVRCLEESELGDSARPLCR